MGVEEMGRGGAAGAPTPPDVPPFGAIVGMEMGRGEAAGAPTAPDVPPIAAVLGRKMGRGGAAGAPTAPDVPPIAVLLSPPTVPAGRILGRRHCSVRGAPRKLPWRRDHSGGRFIEGVITGEQGKGREEGMGGMLVMWNVLFLFL